MRGFGVCKYKFGVYCSAILHIDGKNYEYSDIEEGFYVDMEGERRFFKNGVPINGHWVSLGSLVKIHEEFGTIGLQIRDVECIGYKCKDERWEFEKIRKKILKIGY
eukprot:TRINITY_DN11766_c0_g1_i1.p1 TRINITY_DN11766_c0_g1~~TRINITY_DN11766_c0_g1_i1.p1  ORF type:complete len:120 (+),score=31.07 TRINITY_DN11766_c0_g1_i1:43-360(+)